MYTVCDYWCINLNMKQTWSVQPSTLLTNLQRGNTQTLTPVLDKEEMTLHERAGQGEISKEDLDNGKLIVRGLGDSEMSIATARIDCQPSWKTTFFF